RDLAAQEALVAIERLEHGLLVAAAERHHVDGRLAQVGRHAHLGHGDHVCLEHRVVHVAARENLRERMTDQLAGAQRALRGARSGLAMMMACHDKKYLAASAVVLTFRSVSRQPLSSERQNQNRTSTLELLVSVCFRRSHEKVPQSDASVGSGTLAS